MSSTVENCELPASGQEQLDDILLRREHDIGRHFKNRQEYEYFMMLPVDEARRQELLGLLLQKHQRDDEGERKELLQVLEEKKPKK